MIYFDNGILENSYRQKIENENKSFNSQSGYGLNNSQTILSRDDIIRHINDWWIFNSFPKFKDTGFSNQYKCLLDSLAGNDDFINIKHIAEKLTISVITLVYNADKKWLFQSIYSILWQITDFNYELELIFICDPTCWQEIEWITELSKKYSHVDFRVVNNKTRLGYAGSYNKALSLCTGDYIFIQDTDDISHPERFFWSIHNLHYNENILGAGFIPIIFNNNTNFYDSEKVESGRPAYLNSTMENLLDATLLRRKNSYPFFRFNPQTLCMKKEISFNIRIPDKYVREDEKIKDMDRVFLYHWLMEYPDSLVQNNRCLLFFRHHNSQTTRIKSRQMNIQFNTKLFQNLSDSIIRKYKNTQIMESLIHLKEARLQNIIFDSTLNRMKSND